MAKKQSNDMDIMASINANLRKYNPNVATINESTYAIIKDWISTGHYVLNAAISGDMFRGIPSGRITTLSGESGTGKTFLLLNIYRNAQEKGYTIYHFDSENALDKEMIRNFGLDGDKLVHIPVTTVEEFKGQISTMLFGDDFMGSTKSEKGLQHYKRAGYDIPKIFIGLDSVGMLASLKEVNDAVNHENKADMTRAKALKGLFRIITTTLGELDIPMVCVNHTYQTQEMFSKAVVGGGTGSVYASSNIINLTKAQDKEGDEKVGLILTATPMKNRFALPVKVKFKLNFKRGMNPFTSLEDYVDWETCGIDKGDLSYKKTESGKEEVFVPKATSRKYAVRHLEGHVSTGAEFFSDRVFTMEVLNAINEKKIKPMMKLSDFNDSDLFENDAEVEIFD